MIDDAPDALKAIMQARVATIIRTPKQKKRWDVKGGAVLRGFEDVLDAQWASYVGFTDADDSTDLRQTGNLLRALVADHASVAIGSRWHDKGSQTNVPLSGRISSKLYNWWVRVILFPLRKITDTQRGFKLYRKDILEKIMSANPKDKFFSFDTELLLLAKLAGAKIGEVPIAWVDEPVYSTVSLFKHALPMFLRVLWQARLISNT